MVGSCLEGNLVGADAVRTNCQQSLGMLQDVSRQLGALTHPNYMGVSDDIDQFVAR